MRLVTKLAHQQIPLRIKSLQACFDFNTVHEHRYVWSLQGHWSLFVSGLGEVGMDKGSALPRRQHFLFFCLFMFCRMEPRASHMLSKHFSLSYTLNPSLGDSRQEIGEF